MKGFHRLLLRAVQVTRKSRNGGSCKRIENVTKSELMRTTWPHYVCAALYAIETEMGGTNNNPKDTCLGTSAGSDYLLNSPRSDHHNEAQRNGSH